MAIDHHPEWQRNRVACVVERCGEELRDCKTLVNMGALYGDLCHIIRDEHGMGHISCLNEEGWPSNVEIGRGKYPWARWSCVDYETCDLTALEHADVIVNWGLLYHVSPSRFRAVLESSITRADRLLFVETEVIDCDDASRFIVNTCEREKVDQGLAAEETKPSIAYVEETFRQMGVSYERIDDPRLDHLSAGVYIEGRPCGHVYMYSWPVKNTGVWIPGRRKFWIVRK